MTLHPAIRETLPPDSMKPEAVQFAWRANVNILVPGTDAEGNPLDYAAACDYVSETLRDAFLDWYYTNRPDGHAGPVRLEVCKPYVEGTG